MGEIASNLSAVRERIARAAERSGRREGDVELVVVTKTWPVEVVREVVETGPVILGENKLQEAEDKIPRLPAGTRWHFIGQLQRNKARKAVELFEAIHSIDSRRLAERVDRLAAELGKRPRVYLQVNAAGETSKAGFSEEELRREAGAILDLANLEVAGLMAIPPPVDDPQEARDSFRSLRRLREDLQQSLGRELPGLSMGMSHDFEVAIEEGATIVRVGSAVFGPRGKPPSPPEPDPNS